MVFEGASKARASLVGTGSGLRLRIDCSCIHMRNRYQQSRLWEFSLNFCIPPWAWAETCELVSPGWAISTSALPPSDYSLWWLELDCIFSILFWEGVAVAMGEDECERLK